MTTTQPGLECQTGNGTTALYVLIGDPIWQVRAPALVNPLFARRGIDAVLVPAWVPAAELAELVPALQRIRNLRGLLVTVPHKRDILAFADQVSRRAALSGGANAVRREADGAWYAENFDGAGFTRGLERAGHPVRDRRVCLVGAGGAGSAIAVAVLEAGAAALRVVDTDPGRLAALRDRTAAHFPGRIDCATRPRLDDIDLAVNATPLGLKETDPLPFDPAGLPGASVVADIIMEPAETRLLAAARRRGYFVHPGIHTLENQIDSYAAFFGW